MHFGFASRPACIPRERALCVACTVPVNPIQAWQQPNHRGCSPFTSGGQNAGWAVPWSAPPKGPPGCFPATSLMPASPCLSFPMRWQLPGRQAGAAVYLGAAL